MRLPVVTRWSFCFLMLQATSPSPLLRYSSSLYLPISPRTPLTYLIYDDKHFILNNVFRRLFLSPCTSSQIWFLRSLKQSKHSVLHYRLAVFGVYFETWPCSSLRDHSFKWGKLAIIAESPTIACKSLFDKYALCELHNPVLDPLITQRSLGQGKPRCVYVSCSTLWAVSVYFDMAGKESLKVFGFKEKQQSWNTEAINF